MRQVQLLLVHVYKYNVYNTVEYTCTINVYMHGTMYGVGAF